MGYMWWPDNAQFIVCLFLTSTTNQLHFHIHRCYSEKARLYLISVYVIHFRNVLPHGWQYQGSATDIGECLQIIHP
ncbi:hypothetical protein F5146DRAFT_725082, partial [Armillaria mellea]